MLQGLKCCKRRNYLGKFLKFGKSGGVKDMTNFMSASPPKKMIICFSWISFTRVYIFSDCISCILFHIVPDIHVTLKASQMAQKMWLLPSAICKGLLYAKVAATFSFNEIPN